MTPKAGVRSEPRLFYTSERHSLLVLVLLLAESGLISVGDVEETVGVLTLFVDLAHERVALEHVAPIHEEVERVLLGHLDALADDKRELVRRQVVGHQVSIVKGEIYLGLPRTYLFLSMSGSLEVADFSQMMGMRSGYYSLILLLCSLRWSVRQALVSGGQRTLTEVRVLLLIGLCSGHLLI